MFYSFSIVGLCGGSQHAHPLVRIRILLDHGHRSLLHLVIPSWRILFILAISSLLSLVITIALSIVVWMSVFLFPKLFAPHKTNKKQTNAHQKKQVLLKKDSSLGQDTEERASEVENKSEVPGSDPEKGEAQIPSNAVSGSGNLSQN